MSKKQIEGSDYKSFLKKSYSEGNSGEERILSRFSIRGVCDSFFQSGTFFQ